MTPAISGGSSVAQDISSVTAACMAVPKAVFERVGGFDEEHLPVAFNDVDLCLRIGHAGYRIIWTPYAELYHVESKSRGSDQVPSQFARFLTEAEYMRDRWPEQIAADPFFNPNLSLESSCPEPAFPPRSRKPWLPATETGPKAPAEVTEVEPPTPIGRADILLAPLHRSARHDRPEPSSPRPRAGTTPSTIRLERHRSERSRPAWG